MQLIIGYVFGGFSKKPGLAAITKEYHACSK
jgi:hypothetical protein